MDNFTFFMHQLASKKYELLSTPKTLDELREEFSKKNNKPSLDDWYKFIINASKVLKETPNSEILRLGEIDFIFKIGSRAQQSNDLNRHIWVEEQYYIQVSTAFKQISENYNSKVKLLNERFMKAETAREEKIKRDTERKEWLNSEQSRKLIEDEAQWRIEQEKLKKIEVEAQRRIQEEKQLFEQAVLRRMNELRV